MATSSTYCTHRDLKDIYPNMDEFDNKTAIYGWESVSGVSNLYVAYNTGLVTQLYIDGRELAAANSAVDTPNANDEWNYQPTTDLVYYYSDAINPADYLMESGVDLTTLLDRIMKNASRYVDARIDAGIPRDAFKDKEGNYDYFLVRTTALVSIHFLVNSHNPGSELADSFMEEANFNIDQINTGKTKLSYQVSGDSSSGVVREVTSPQNANPLYIVDTRGHYTGVYDLIKIVISTTGAIGTAKYDVYHGDDTGLKQNKVVDAELITGKYQTIGGGLQVRFAGSTDASVATANDEWELECWGAYESLDGSPGSNTNTRLTRRSY